MKTRMLVLAAAATLIAPVATGELPECPGLSCETGVSAGSLVPIQQLGRRLFHDERLSEPRGQSCATCHAPATAFTDPDAGSPTSQGVDPALFGNRNAPSAMYAAFSPTFHFDEAEGLYVGGQFWDGRAATLEEQAKGPFLNPLEMANPDKETVVRKIRESEYAGLFRRVFGADVFDDPALAFERAAEAIAAFERTRAFSPFGSKYDAWLAGRARLTAQELRGLELFEREDKGNCAACHPSRPADVDTPPLFTDFTFDNLGVPRNPENRFYAMPARFNPAGAAFVDPGLGGVTGESDQDGKHKVPTLRNVALTAPYMHNGYFRTLRGVVDFYNTRDTKPRCDDPFTVEASAIAQNCWPVAEVENNVNTDELGNLRLTDEEVDDIVAYLHTLTDGWRPRGGR